MNTNSALKFAPAINGEKRIDLSMTDDTASIQLSSWVEGLGWCGEKTLSLDPAMVDELHRVLTAARVKMKSRRTDSGETAENINVLKFPAIDRA